MPYDPNERQVRHRPSDDDYLADNQRGQPTYWAMFVIGLTVIVTGVYLLIACLQASPTN